jgi:hypothetical protein
MGFFTLKLNDRAIEELLHDPAGPVGDLLSEIAAGMTARAVARVPFQKPENFSWSRAKSTSYMPWSSGFTAGSIWMHPAANDASGRLFAGTNAAYAPTLWLERGRSHPRMTLHPFLTEALYSTTV